MTINVIAEIGSNWGGDIELAKQHIKKSKDSGATHVKFQMWRATDLYTQSHPNWNEIVKSQLNEDDARELKKFADTIGIEWFASVFYPESVDILESLDVKMYKIASRTSTLNDNFSFETIQKVAATQKLTFISTGEGADKNKITELFKNTLCKFTYCISQYPTPDSEINWNELLQYNFFSDHSVGITMPLLFTTLKNSKSDELFIEKHVKMDDDKGPDSEFSITYDELSQMISHISRINVLNLRNILNS